LAEQGEKQKKELRVDVANLETRKKSLDQDCRFNTNLILQLQADVDAENELRRFSPPIPGVKYTHGISGRLESSILYAV